VAVPPRQKQGDDRIFLTKGALELEKPFSGDLTAYRAKQLTADFLGKWIRWTIPIDDVTLYGEEPFVFAYVPDAPRLHLSVNVTFLPSEREKVMHLEKGAIIEIEGKIEKISSRRVELTECILIGVIPSA
jgi:hypothetical protein